jgi:hypothetical protein
VIKMVISSYSIGLVSSLYTEDFYAHISNSLHIQSLQWQVLTLWLVILPIRSKRGCGLTSTAPRPHGPVANGKVLFQNAHQNSTREVMVGIINLSLLIHQQRKLLVSASHPLVIEVLSSLSIVAHILSFLCMDQRLRDSHRDSPRYLEMLSTLT